MNDVDNSFLKKSGSLYMVISAPSGTGKTSICRKILKMYPNIRYSISYTTRPKRRGEKNGRDYYFVSEEFFRERISKGGFAEWVENFGYLYGTSIDTIELNLNQGFDLIMDVEPWGAKEIKKNYPGGTFIFILPPSMDELKVRLNKRGYESEESLMIRLDKAVKEIKEIFWYDYVIFNNQLDDAVDTLRSIYIAEKNKRERLEKKINNFLKISS